MEGKEGGGGDLCHLGPAKTVEFSCYKIFDFGFRDLLKEELPTREAQEVHILSRMDSLDFLTWGIPR